MADETRDERTVRILLFDYTGTDGVSRGASAYKGDRAALLPEDIKRGDELLAFEESVALTDEGGYLDLTSATDDQILEWMQTDQPTVQAVVDASGGDGELAQRLLDLEGKATEGNPRKGVLAGLQSVIDRAAAEAAS